jgi:hypothetical protein
MAFQIVKRDLYDCEHDTGVMHSTGYTCEEAELMVAASHMREDDPLHRATWHKK